MVKEVSEATVNGREASRYRTATTVFIPVPVTVRVVALISTGDAGGLRVGALAGVVEEGAGGGAGSATTLYSPSCSTTIFFTCCACSLVRENVSSVSE